MYSTLCSLSQILSCLTLDDVTITSILVCLAVLSVCLIPDKYLIFSSLCQVFALFAAGTLKNLNEDSRPCCLENTDKAIISSCEIVFTMRYFCMNNNSENDAGNNCMLLIFTARIRVLWTEVVGRKGPTLGGPYSPTTEVHKTRIRAVKVLSYTLLNAKINRKK